MEDALKRARDAIAAGQSCIGFFGLPGSGRTTVAQRAVAGDYALCLRLSVPRDDDGAIAAIVSLAAQLPSPEATTIVKNTSRTYLERLGALMALVPKGSALLFDEPQLSDEGGFAETIFAVRARQFASQVLKHDFKLKVFTANRPDPAQDLLGAHLIEVKREAAPQVVTQLADLNEPDSRRFVADNAALLAQRSPIEIRLAAWLATRGVDDADLSRTSFRLRELVRLAARRISSGAKGMLARLALVREPTVSQWLEWAAAGSKAEDRALVEKVFLFGDDAASLRLHDSIAELAREQRWLALSKSSEAHRQLAERYKAQFSRRLSSEQLGQALRAEIEVVYHRTMAGDAGVLEDTIYFAEQYDAVGRAFGQRGERQMKQGDRRPGRISLGHAITCYERALENDHHDWYAAHYLAFNLDVLGDDVLRIEQQYRRAIELRPTFVWGHSRWIRFLVTCGRYAEAMDAFEAALEVCGSNNPIFFRELHLDVARQFLQAGAYRQAQAVLERVPEAARAQLDRFEPLSRYAKWQEEPDLNQLVFPPFRSMASRDTPAFLQSGEVCESFMPGRLAAIEGHTYRFRVRLQTGQFGWRDETAESLRALGLNVRLRVGAFVEFLKVKGAKERASLHPTEEPFRDLEVRYPPPDRYADA
ncbi:MAG: tetratricopeptide repeat protein [Myxococcus sp.]|nr:tetratricopeptide repeat protein [Myxococcus sp.]